MIDQILEVIKQNPENSIFVGVLLTAIFSFSTTSSFIIKKRIGYASFMGKIEHKSGRILGLLIVLTAGIEYFNLGFTLYGLIACFICWIIYLLSHTLEKLLYGNHGFR